MSATTTGVPLTERRYVLLDFDGPVCAVFGGVPDNEVADALRQELPGGDTLPESVLSSHDPFAVLSRAYKLGPNTAVRFEQ
jgi:hypothetical protein